MGNIYYVLLLAVAYVLATRLHLYLQLRRFKGPFIAQWTNLWGLHLALSGRAYEIFEELPKRYGKKVHIYP